MKTLCVITVFLVLAANTLAQETKPNINNLKWITGCWESNNKNELVTEQWMKPAGNSMLGMSRTVANGKTSAYEFLRIIQENFEVFYIANPSKQQETSFKLIKQTNNEAIFENPTHDFPQRIIYRLKSKTSLVARIEGDNKGKQMGFDYPMKRVKCD